MTDLELMQSIKTKWGTAIAAAASVSSVPEAFLAALIANESGGDQNAKRFEKGVLASLWEVLLGRKAAYGSIATQDLVKFVANITVLPVQSPQSLPTDAFNRLDSLATSWGLTQIMGYESIPFHTIGGVLALRDPVTELPVTTRMLAGFARSWQLDVTRDFDKMFDCWNTGRPHSPTADPQYIPNGLARMQEWDTL